METGRKNRRSRDEWRALLRRFEESDLSLAAFCRAEAVSVASVQRWRGLFGHRVGQDVQQIEATKPAFVDLGALPPATGQAARIELTLDLGSGQVLHLVRG